MKRIVLLSDGTGNAVSRVWRTNVWRLYEALDLSDADQVAFYDDGVGTSSFKPMAIFGGAFGWGLKRNVLDLYVFLSRHYKPGDEIYAFGFSRGAFTIRVLIGLVMDQSLVRGDGESELQRQARLAYRAYRRRYHTWHHLEILPRALRDLLVAAKDRLQGRAAYDRTQNGEAPDIRFVGVWDSVAAYGLPIEEMTHGVSRWLWPLEFRDRELNPKVRKACHALALDDERTTFHPLLWTESTENQTSRDVAHITEERISQVWFPGVHSNVGGGYPDDSLAFIPLHWMMTEAARDNGLRFKKTAAGDDAVLRAKLGSDKDGRLYNPRAGLGGYYRYGPRKLEALSTTRFVRKSRAVNIDRPKIHESVIARIRGGNGYAPVGLPADYAVVTEDGRILAGTANPCETPAQSQIRAQLQEGVWDLVWVRRVIYFLAVAASLYLFLFPVIHRTNPAAEFETPLRIFVETLRLVGSFLPNFLRWWFNAFATNIGTFLIGVGALIFFVLIGGRLRSSINDRMTRHWSPTQQSSSAILGRIYRFRTSSFYQFILTNMKLRIVPALSVVVIVYAAAALISHFMFNILDGAGRYCHESPSRLDIAQGRTVVIADPFPTSALCWPTGVGLLEGHRYHVTLERQLRWMDHRYESSITGFEISELPTFLDRIKMLVALPARRVLLRPWFRPILRIGGVGTDESFMDPPKATVLDAPVIESVGAQFRSRRSGELFIYVNDAVLPIPGFEDLFYRNNNGTARVTIRHVGP